MKKLLSVLLISLLVLAGCGSNNDKDKEPDTNGGDTASTIKVGTGIVTGTRVADAGDEDGKFESNVTYATVVLDGETIKAVQIDTAQNAIAVTKDGAQEFTARKTKGELKEEYGMKGAGSSLEWYEQIAKVQEWMVGKTVADLDKLAEDTDVASSVSIDTTGYVTAVKNAIANAVVAEGATKIGQASTASGKIENGLEISTTVASTALDADGKIVYAFIDTAQLKGTVTDNVVAWDNQGKTKGELKEEYGMKKAGSAKEWNEQVEVLTAYAIGKTPADLAKASEDSDVASSVSITIDYLIGTLDTAATNAVAF